MPIVIPRHPNYSRNARKEMDAYPCVVCGKECPTPRFMVHLHGYNAVTEDEARALNDAGGESDDMGGYPIGADCLRAHPELRPYAHTVTR